MRPAIACCRCSGARKPKAPGLPMLSLTRVRPAASSSRARRASSPRISYRTSDRRSRVFRLGGDIGGGAAEVAAKPIGKRPAAPDATRGARLESAHGHHPPPRLTAAPAALRAIGWPWPGEPDEPAWREAMAAHPQARPVRVVEQHRSGYVVANGPGEGFAVESPPEWQRPAGYRKRSSSRDQRAAVGDWVLLDGNRIVALLPRRTAIKRAAAGEHYQQ